MPTLSASQFPPPVSWEELELLVWSLYKATWNDPYAQRNGRTGQAQHGVDIFGRPGQGFKWDGIQVKGKNGHFGESVTEQELRAEVQKAQGFSPALENFILLTSARRDQNIQQIARQITEENAASGGFSVTVMGWDDIQERLAEYPDVIREHYPQFSLGKAESTSSQSSLPEQFSSVQLEELIKSLLPQSGTADLHLAPNIAPSLDYPPLKPATFTSRQTTVDQISALVDSRSWVALVGSTGIGKSLLARSLWETTLQDQRYWISFRGQAGRYEHHLDRQLLGWIIKATDDDSLLDRFYSGRIGGTEITQQVGTLVTQGTLLVLDDLPNLSENDILRERLASLAVAWWNAGGKVLSTSQFQAPIRLSHVLGPELYEFAVPEMGHQEVEELLAMNGAPPHWRSPGPLNTLVVLTKGHPVLIAAAIQWLLRNEWRLDDAPFVSLLSGDPFTQSMAEARAQVRRLVASDVARDLLDRLSMVNRSFNHDMVWAVANVNPTMERPIEQFIDLVGPWFQSLADSNYLMSPLLQNSWQVHLQPDLQRRVHGAIAQQYLQSQSISIDEAFQVSIHLAGSEDWLGLARVLLHVMQAAEVPQQFERASWVLWFFRPEDSWPDLVPHQLRIVIRAMQVRGLLLTQKSTASYETDLEQLIERAGPTDSLAVFLAYYQTSFLLDHVSPEKTARGAIQGARAFHRADTSFPGEITVQPEVAFWGAIPKVKELTQISGIIQVVREMTREERAVVFAPPVGTDMARLLVDMCYSIEADEPAEAQDWDTVLGLLQEIQSIGELEGAEVLSYAALRARAMVLADFKGNTQAALSLLDVDFADVNESYRFLLTYTAACILLSHNEPEPALGKFTDALSISLANVFPLVKSDALGRGMIAASLANRIDISVDWGKRALRRGTVEVGVGPYEKIELLSELAWAYWSYGDQKRACGAMYGAVKSLISAGQLDILRHREILVKVGHVLGWLSSVALQGTPPDITIDGQQYTDPYPGMIYLRAKQVPEGDAISPLHYLPSQLAMMATGVGVPRLAIAAYRAAAELGREQGYLVFAAAMDLERAPMEASLGNFDQALEALLMGSRAVPIMQENPSNALDSLDDPDKRWESLDVVKKTSIESFHIFYMVLLPAFTGLVAKGFEPQSAFQAVENMGSAIERMGSRSLLSDRWQRIAKHMGKAFDPASTRNDILNDLENLGGGDDQERFTLYIALASHPQRTPSDMSRLHATVLTHLTTPQPTNRSVIDNVVRWIIGSWQHEINTRPVRLNSPGLLRRVLETMSMDSAKVSDAARLVLASEVVSGTRFSDDLRTLLQQLVEP